MAVSCICHECLKVKRCRLYTRTEYSGTLGVNYLCRPCARKLGYLTHEERNDERQDAAAR